MNDSNLRRYAPALLALVGIVLFLPGLHAFGLWDPYEIHVADAARALVTGGHFTWAPQLGRPPALVWLIAVGFKTLGVGELGGRLPIAILGVVTLLAVYYAGAPLIGRRGALLGAFALATCPGFFLGARQLTSNVPLLLATSLAVGGLCRAAWPPEHTAPGRRALDLLIGLFGLALGQLSVGILVGVVAPLVAVTVGLWAAVGFEGLPAAGAVLSLLALTEALWAFRHVTGYSAVLGGIPHAVQHTVTISTHLTKIGFSLFPWVALAPVATIRAFRESDDARERFGG
ncbi:MAG TPA: glycosyltransferase family 39 protein, partial [Polyangia bacterium]